MDYDDKIRTELQKSRSIFLQDDDFLHGDKPQVYSLEDEFGKTRRNKNPLYYLAVGGFIIGLIAVTVLVTRLVDRSSENIEVNITEFEDVQLKEILNEAKTAEFQLNIANRDLRSLQSDRDMKVNELRDQFAKEKSLVLVQEISSLEKTNQIKALDAQLTKKIREVMDSYNARISSKQEQIVKLREQMTNYDPVLVQNARRQEGVIDNSQQLVDMELNRQKTYYESRIREIRENYERQLRTQQEYNRKLVDAVTLKYNPRFTESNLNNILNRSVSSYSIDSALRPFRPEIAAEEAFSRTLFDSIRAVHSDYYSLFNRVSLVPYTNSIAPSLRQLGYLYYLTVTGYEQAWNSIADAVTRKNSRLARYDYALSQLSRDRRENGFILDARSTRDILIYIDPVYQFKDGTEALVFRNDLEYIARIRLYNEREGARAELVELIDTNRIRSFDKILLDYK